MEIIDSTAYVSEFTKNTLLQFGWVAGDPIPANMGDLIQKIDERTPKPKKTGLLIDAEQMTVEDVELVKAALAAAKVELFNREKKSAVTKQTENMAPAVADFYARLAATEKNKQDVENVDGVQIVDDRAAATEKPAQESIPVVVEEKPAEPELPVVPKLEEALVPAFCPRCNWDTRQKYETEITPADKELFLVTILGDKRFEKSFELFKGKYDVTFRSLLAEETKTIHRQLTIDQKNGEFNSDTEWFLRFFEYRLACSIRRVIVEGKPVAELPDLEAAATTPLPGLDNDLSRPALLRLHDYVIKDLLKGEIVRRLVGKHFREFQRIYEALEAMALEPNFW